MKTKNNKKFGIILAIALLLGFANLSAQAADKAAKPDRPERPSAGKGAKVAELKEIVNNFQEQKKQFLAQQKEQNADSRAKVREELGSTGSAAQDAKDAIAEAKRVSREQARKLADEAKESAKEGRRRE